MISVPFQRKKATLLVGGQALKVEQGNGKTTIHLPNQLPDASATVIRLE